MKAEDTVNQFIKLNLHTLLYDEVERIKEEQARISFKAGIEEVVNWVEVHTNGDRIELITKFISISEIDWKAKLKEWKMK